MPWLSCLWKIGVHKKCKVKLNIFIIFKVMYVKFIMLLKKGLKISIKYWFYLIFNNKIILDTIFHNLNLYLLFINFLDLYSDIKIRAHNKPCLSWKPTVKIIIIFPLDLCSVSSFLCFHSVCSFIEFMPSKMNYRALHNSLHALEVAF